ncbi:hypothetical protein WJT74_11080 [Sphingomicrobium sp. XHP0239]|uniref:hypothetical protein n=1 Tax=Sphingomicrobium maritimum TaxID=3133972 RepID=UPI0031CC9B95
MEPVTFAILLFGCADGGTSCDAVRAVEATFESEAACVAALDDALASSDDVDAPWVEAECRPVARIPAKFRSSLGNLPNS